MSTLSDQTPSNAAVQLGHLALLPFALGAAVLLLGRPAWQPLAGAALSAYAATVVSFVGAIHWGLGMRQTEPPASLFLWGVVPSVVAWAALLMPVGIALAGHAAMLALCLFVDRSVYPRQGVAAWLPLRARLTVIAVSSCLLASWGVGLAR